jgi:hypothetical protein
MSTCRPPPEKKGAHAFTAPLGCCAETRTRFKKRAAYANYEQKNQPKPIDFLLSSTSFLLLPFFGCSLFAGWLELSTHEIEQ